MESNDGNMNPQPPQLIITLKADGNVEVFGPVGAKALALGMLAAAKQIVIEYRPKIELPNQRSLVTALAKGNGV